MVVFYIAVLSAVIALGSSDTSCPTGCVCNVDTVSCNQLDKFPQPFSSTAKIVEIFMSHLPEIPPRAFKDLPNAQMIHLQQVKIGTIRGCAFQDMSINAGVMIDLTEIDTIEGNTFHNIHMSGGQEFSISSSTIGVIHPFAFDSIQSFSVFQIHSTEIRTIHSYAFHRFSNIVNFNMFDVNITTMESNAMEGFMNVRVMDIYHATFTNLECNTLNRLRIDLNRNFSFHSLDVKCDCRLAWLLESHTGSDGLQLDDVICFAPVEFRHQHLKNLTRVDLCDGQSEPSCDPSSPARPEACSARVDSAGKGLNVPYHVSVVTAAVAFMAFLFR